MFYHVLDGRVAVGLFAVEMVRVVDGTARAARARVRFEPRQVSGPHLHVVGRPAVRGGGRVVGEEPLATAAAHLGRGARRGGQRRHGATGVAGAVAVAGRVAGLRGQRGQRGQRVGLLVQELQRAARRYRQLVHLRIRCGVSTSRVPRYPFIVTYLVRVTAAPAAPTATAAAASTGHVHHGLLGQFEFPVRYFAVLALVFPLVAQQLPARMQHVVAAVPHAMDVITHLREPAIRKTARVRFHEFLEPVSGQLLVLDMIGFVFFCAKRKNDDYYL